MPIQLIIRNPLDRDAREFIQRAGVTDAAARSQINEFVRGIKGLGLWDSMVCWPLRSSQNAGTGTTAYSLGGLGTFNGTLVNGPTWGADGINMDSAGSEIIEWTTSPLSDFTTGHAMLGVFLPSGPVPTSATSTDQIRLVQGGVIVMQYGSSGTGSTSDGTAQYRVETGRLVSEFFVQANLKDQYCFYEYDPLPSVRVFSNGGSVAHGGLVAGTFSYNSALAMTMGPTADATNTIAFWAIFKNGVSILSASSQLRDLYKQALGTGLALP
jgi:hypothetical protein